VENKNSKKGLIVALITVAVLVVGVFGASYAYFQATIGSAATTYLNVRTNTVDNLKFSSAAKVNLLVTMADMLESTAATNNIVVSSVNYPYSTGRSSVTNGVVSGPSVTATLTAKNSGASTYCYKVSITATTSTLARTVTNVPELVVKSVTCDGGTSYCYNPAPASQLDITTTLAKTPLCQHQTIQANAGATTTKTCTVDVVFRNYKTINQSPNAGKYWEGSVTIEQDTCS
jgi:hypothetical protein